MADVLVVSSKIKELVKGQGCNSSGDLAEALSKKVEALVKDGVERAKANGRKTLKAIDV